MVVDLDELNRLALKEGDLNSLVELAEESYRSGDYEKAFACAYRASLRLYAPGERKLGFFYEKGIGTPVNIEKAVTNYQLAYKHHDVIAAYNLALLYSSGKGVEKDENKAFQLANEAMDGGVISAIKLLSEFHYNGVGTPVDEKQGYQLLKKCLEMGDTGVYYRLGYYKYQGKGTEKNLDEAFQYFFSGAEQNDVNCMYSLGCIFCTDEHKDYCKATYWFNQGSQKNDPRCMFNLAKFFEKGVYFASDIEKAKFWYKKAADMGFEKAIEHIQNMRY